ncbi:MAG: DUF1194 domain-containing protein, partial [Alphaproteobacteria bacterium]|nr:DUF1194 domain-containing protein [Alphaproteobacteria bacterium]
QDRNVQLAIAAGQHAAIAVSLVQWSTRVSQSVSLGWSAIRTPSDAAAAARAIANTSRQWLPGGTGLAAGIAFCTRHFQALPFQASRRTIDVSGDGDDNEGGDVAGARAAALAAQVTINGLPIISGSPTIADYYANEVIGGPDCFYVPAATIMDFGEAMTRKLLREVEANAA